ncbi:hypothetical protein [Streptomyces sp. GQFP]|uniref:hypothetical protein n=1 Tax=Streptomyces sp. GQFP TaxID=2907545 RepID=UPI001F1624E4|nr:hypothetical protein [Streptomyces sp. GQFP]UIX32471.1 hypothetical protein LUX31_21880 [Streptomyces sp. GQFP]
MPTETDLTPLLTAWDQAHPAVTAVTVADMNMGTNMKMNMSTNMDADWRHLLDEIAHPHTTQAFHRLAVAAA